MKIMSDEQFERICELVEHELQSPDAAAMLSARDAVQHQELARVEAERDAERRALAEALGLISQVLTSGELERTSPTLHAKLESCISYNAQAEQQEVPKRGKPDWNSHGYDQIFQTSDGNWFGARAGWDFKGHISDGWKGREVSLLRDDGGFLAYGEPNPDWENSLEQRPAQEAQGAQSGEFQREDRYIVIKRKDLEAIENSGESSDLETHEAVRFLAEALDTLQPLLPQRQYLVIESDWPEYETTWTAIQARVTGQGAQPGEFWAWLDLAYRDGSKGEGRNFTKYNMEVAYRAGTEAARAALASQPAAIKLPERRPIDQKDNFRRGCAHGFNACLIAVSRLNAVRGAEE